MAGGAEDRRLAPEQTEQLKSIGVHLPRERQQDGHVCKEGVHPHWKGHYFIYLRQSDGGEKRIHHKIDLGPVTGLTKKGAKLLLRATIAKALKSAPEPASQEMTLRRFWEERYKPLKLPTWKSSSRERTVDNIERYVIHPFADVPISRLDKFSLQMRLNELAVKHSKSVCLQFRVYMRSILEEAVDQDLLGKNPARKLEIPQTRKTCNRFLTIEEITDLLAAAPPRDRLILRMLMVLGLRIGEQFALHRDDVAGQIVRIDQSASWKQDLVTPKNEASNSFVWLPVKLAAELKEWMDSMQDQSQGALLFATKMGTPLDRHNFLGRNLKQIVAAALKARSKAGIETRPLVTCRGSTIRHSGAPAPLGRKRMLR